MGIIAWKFRECDTLGDSRKRKLGGHILMRVALGGARYRDGYVEAKRRMP